MDELDLSQLQRAPGGGSEEVRRRVTIGAGEAQTGLIHCSSCFCYLVGFWGDK